MKHKRLNILFALRVYYPKIHQGLVAYAQKANWSLRFCRTNQEQEVLNWHGDGVIIGTGLLHDRAEELKSLPCPVINIGNLPGIHSIFCENKLIAEKAYLHFKERQFINYATYTRWANVGYVRQAEFEKIVKGEGLHCASIRPSQDDDWLERRKNIIEQVKALKKPVAVFTEQDETALELIDICLSAGISVPEEVAIIGVRNDDLICAPSIVPISSVENLQFNHGYKAGEYLDDLIHGRVGEDELSRLYAPGDVITRRSTDVYAVNHDGVLKALKFIQQNFRGGITTQDIVKASEMSHNGLLKAFKTHLKRTPSEELLRVRLDSAKELLQNSNLSINEIAGEAGFGDYHSLYFAFKRVFGQTPKEYRNNSFL